MIEERFLNFKTLNGFQTALNSGDIPNNSIAFIEDERLIWTHGKYYCKKSIDEKISSTSTNPVQNKVIAAALAKKADAEAVDSELQDIRDLLQGYQEKLTSGENIKTINGESILGSGDISITGGGGVVEKTKHIFLEEGEYEALEEYEKDAIYFVYEPEETDWVFGNSFPITLI